MEKDRIAIISATIAYCLTILTAQIFEQLSPPLLIMMTGVWIFIVILSLVIGIVRRGRRRRG